MSTKDKELLAILESNLTASDKVLLLNSLKQNPINCYTCKSLLGRRYLLTSQCSWWKKLFGFRRTEVFQITSDQNQVRFKPVCCDSNEEEALSNEVKLIKIDDQLTYRLTVLRRDPALRDFEPPRGYLAVSKHGQGGFANVYKVFNCKKRRFHAFKKTKPDRLRDSMKDEQRGLEEEFEMLRSLRHGSIVSVYNYHHQTRCLEMDFCHGGSLYEHVKNGRKVAEEDSKAIFRQVFGALSYLHEEQGVTHRDVKTENVLFTGECPHSKVKLVDFGLAIGRTREMYDACGTDVYMAPEVAVKLLRGDAKAYECSVDVWGAGVCLYECATGGRLPFGGNPRVETFSKLQTVPGELTEYLEDVVDGRSEANLGLLGVAQWHPLHALLGRIFRKEFFKRPRCSEVLKHDWFKNW